MVNKEKYSFITQNDYEVVAGPDWPPFSAFVEHNNIPDFVYQEIDSMLLPPQTFDHPSFCVLPFYGLEYPLNTFCCLVPGGSNREEVKKEMLAGKRPSACQKCWHLEDHGFKSDRIIKNETLDFYANKNIKDLYNECVEGKSSIVNFKIETNNVCNATCATCGSNSSSSWAKLERQNGKKPFKTWRTSNHKIDQVINYKTAESISFRGGEPFMSKTNFYVLEKLIENSNTDCFISFVTNGSFNLTQKQLELIKQFPRANFCFSLDGIGPVFEYLRYPLKFDQIQRNLEFCRINQIVASVSYTVSNLNILYHNQTVDWFKQHDLNFIVNPVYHPSYFRAGALPQSLKKQILQQLDPAVHYLIQDHTDKDDLDFARFKQEIAKQDAWKNIQLKHYLPELAALLDS